MDETPHNFRFAGLLSVSVSQMCPVNSPPRVSRHSLIIGDGPEPSTASSQGPCLVALRPQSEARLPLIRRAPMPFVPCLPSSYH
jgi:hypothetical protein